MFDLFAINPGDKLTKEKKSKLQEHLEEVANEIAMNLLTHVFR
jgi:hypothetical protein